MPMYEQVPIKITLIVEVDGHRLEFSETAKASGGRNATDDTSGQILEDAIRGSVDTSIERVHRKAMNFVSKAWANATPDREGPAR